MRLAEAYCKECDVTFKVRCNGDTPPFSNLTCPICLMECKATWIDRDDQT